MRSPKSAARRPALTYGDDHLHTLQRNTFRYFWQETNPENGLIPDNTGADNPPASTAGVGFALASYPVAAERSFVPRAQAVERMMKVLGVAGSRIKTVSYGEEKPLCQEHNESCWRQNRRAEIVYK